MTAVAYANDGDSCDLGLFNRQAHRFGGYHLTQAGPSV